MWFSIVFAIGIVLFISFAFVARLHKFKGTRFKTRMNYGLGVSLFFTLLYLWQTDGKMQIIGKGLLLGAVLCVPFCLYSKRWIEKRIEGTTIFYKRKQYFRRLILLIPIAVLTMIFFHLHWGKQVLNARWPILGLCISWLISQFFILSYVAKLERKLGRPILEDQK